MPVDVFINEYSKPNLDGSVGDEPHFPQGITARLSSSVPSISSLLPQALPQSSDPRDATVDFHRHVEFTPSRFAGVPESCKRGYFNVLIGELLGCFDHLDDVEEALGPWKSSKYSQYYTREDSAIAWMDSLANREVYKIDCTEDDQKYQDGVLEAERLAQSYVTPIHLFTIKTPHNAIFTSMSSSTPGHETLASNSSISSIYPYISTPNTRVMLPPKQRRFIRAMPALITGHVAISSRSKQRNCLRGSSPASTPSRTVTSSPSRPQSPLHAISDIHRGPVTCTSLAVCPPRPPTSRSPSYVMHHVENEVDGNEPQHSDVIIFPLSDPIEISHAVEVSGVVSDPVF